MDVAPKLPPRERARALDAFAEEFDALPPSWEPSCGWAAEMAYLCRRMARELRGEAQEEWAPQWERQRHKPNGVAVPAMPPVTAIGDTHVADEVVFLPAM